MKRKFTPCTWRHRNKADFNWNQRTNNLRRAYANLST